MLTVICITLLAYCIMGKDIRSLLERIKEVDWKGKSKELFDKLRPYALKAGRVAARPMLQFYYVMTDEKTPTIDKALVYAAIIYTISPVSLIPRPCTSCLAYWMKARLYSMSIRKSRSGLRRKSMSRWMTP